MNSSTHQKAIYAAFLNHSTNSCVVYLNLCVFLSVSMLVVIGSEYCRKQIKNSLHNTALVASIVRHCMTLNIWHLKLDNNNSAQYKTHQQQINSQMHV